jgi:hypothetical protein
VIGRQLSKLEDLTEATNRAVINGQSMNVSSAVTTASIEQVLDRVEELCRTNSALRPEFARLASTPGADVPGEGGGDRLGLMRQDHGEEGFVACLAQSPQNQERPLVEGLAAFLGSFDLADVGLLRYVYARKTDAGHTHVLTMWTDGSFLLDSLSPPADGRDAPGSDPANAPRPRDSVRYLTATVAGAPHAVRIYESRAGVGEILAQFDAEMPGRGWTKLDAIEVEIPDARYFEREGVELMLLAVQNGERSAVSVVETRSP